MRDFRYSGQEWAVKLKIPISDPKGWDSLNSFNHLLITKEEFCNRAANSVVKLEKAATRREAAEMLRKNLGHS